MKVQVVEPNGFLDGAIKRDHGDVFNSDMGDEFVRLGWCKNFKTGKTGKRIPGMQKLNVKNIMTKLK